MPSKLRKALGAVKDQTSISLAKVVSSANSSSTVNLEVPILKATSHDEVPFDDRYLADILQVMIAADSKLYAAACAQAIAKRVGKTRNWIVALKSLMLVLRIFQDGDPHFPREVLGAMKNGAKILNLSNFRDDSNSSPWDYTAFVRTFALYLDERLDCFLSGKLHQRRFHSESGRGSRRRAKVEPVRDMKPATLIDRISYWQKLLDRAIATRPTGEAKTNRLVQSSLHAIVQESFDIYRDISDGLALLLDSFFHLQYQSCVNAFQASVRASKQFEELAEFYGLCKSIGVGRTSEYPSVQKISDELIETLQDFLKDQASFPGRPQPQNFLLALPSPPAAAASDQASTSSDRCEADDGSETQERVSATGSESGSIGSSHDQDPMSASDSEKQSETEEDFIDADDDNEQEANVGMNFISFDYWPPDRSSSLPVKKDRGSEENPRDCWEVVLLNTAKEPAQTTPNFESNGLDGSLFDKRQYNPFLQETTDVTTVVVIPDMNKTYNSFTLDFGNPRETTLVAPTFCASSNNSEEEIRSRVPPTFCAQNPKDAMKLSFDENDPFEWHELNTNTTTRNDGSVTEEGFIHEQKLWLEHQKKIIAKNMN
ncbi:AP180 N-terminal domain containing protein [Parasponia andersonii]|uniref:AP180 N-terminal domain containing protein n=1 Tax=Parasponia andersonii TaxID=3476 RepID=A0A2P5AYP2_PARAD|nr:AP180 N-terminal domain containing protein [Parasponia andersonii]